MSVPAKRITVSAVLPIALSLAFIATGAAWAGPVPLGGKFSVSSCGDCRKEAPAVAGTPSGRFLVVWQGAGTLTPRVPDVRARLFAPSGAPRTRDFLLDPRANLQQYDAAVAADPQSGYVAAWSAVANGNSDVFAQRFSPLGARLGPAIQVNVDASAASPPPIDASPAVAKFANGGFVAVWIRLAPAGKGDPPAVLARRFSAAGVPLGPPVQLNSGLASGDRPAVCVDSFGRPVAVWTSVDGFFPFEPSKKGVSARRLSVGGVPLGSGETMIAAPENDGSAADVSCGPGGSFAVAWQADQAPAVARGDILVRRFNRFGGPIGGPILVNTKTDGEQKSPAIAHDPAGNFVVVWESDAGVLPSVSGRRFAASGAASGPEFTVATLADGLPAKPDVATVGGIGGVGNFVVVWRDGVAGLFGQRFSP